jgi:phosphoribosylformylglycinamidine synthase
MVGTNNTSTNTPTDATVVLVKGTRKGIAMTTDCNSRYVFADPYKGTMIAVSEAARNIVCSGGQPLGVTNCLNFGNPYDPEVYYQFVYAIKGMGEACRKFDTPVTGGNVSFYNQNPDGPVYPTPTIGMVGLLEDVSKKMTLDFKEAGDVILLIGSSGDDINSSQYLSKICGVEFSPLPHFDLEEEYVLQQKITELISKGLIESAHDVSEGGLFVTLLESSFNNILGFDVVANDYNTRKDAQWFGEKQSRVVVSVKKEKLEAVKKALGNHSFEELGMVTDGSVEVDGMEWGHIEDWKEKYDSAIENYLSKEEAGSALSSI